MSQSETELYETTGPAFSRRNFLRATAAGAGAATVGVGSTQTRHSPIQPADAFVPLAPVGVMVGAVAVEWTLREVADWMDGDEPPEGLTGEVLHQQIIAASEARKSNNASTIIDNKNILEGAEHVAYSDGKVAAIELLTDDPSQEEFQEAAVDAALEHLATVQKNLYASWEEAAYEVSSFYDTVEANEDLDPEDVWYAGGEDEFGDQGITTIEYEYEFVNGEETDVTWVKQEHIQSDNSPRTSEMAPHAYEHGQYTGDEIELLEGDFAYLVQEDWEEINDEIIEIADDVSDGLIVWADGVYGDLQAGDLEIEELIGPSELAEMLPEEETGARGVADLVALNRPVDLDHEAQIRFTEGDGENMNLYGNMAQIEEGEREVGNEIDPSEEDSQIFMTYDPSEVHGEWDWYENEVDGGVVTITREPIENSLIEVETNQGEFVSAPYDEWDPDDEDDPEEWTHDFSDDLDDAIAEVEEMNFYSLQEESETDLTVLDDSFEIVAVDGIDDPEEAEPISFDSPTETHTDDNYQTAEDFEQQSDDMLERLGDIEEELASNGGGGWPGFGDIGAGAIAPIAIVGGAIIALFALTD